MYQKGHLQFNTGRTWFKKGLIPWNKKEPVYKICLVCGKRFQIKPARIKTAKYCCLSCLAKGVKTGLKFTEEHRRRISEAQRGQKSKNWKGGITPKVRGIRNSVETKIWRDKVFQRDNYACWICEKRGGKLVAHHLKKFSDYPKLRFIVSNGLTLCKICHKIYTNFH